MRRAVMIELLHATEGATVRDIRRGVNYRLTRNDVTAAEVTGALRVFYNAGLAVKSAAKDARWWPTPALHVAAETLCPEVFEET